MDLVDKVDKLADMLLPDSVKSDLNEPDVRDLLWYWKIRLMIYLLFVYIIQAINSNWMDTLYTAQLPSTLLGYCVFLLLFVRFYSVTHKVIHYPIFLIPLLSFYGMARNDGFYLMLSRAPLIILTSTIQLGKRSILPTTLSVIAIMYHFYSDTDWLTKSVTSESFVRCIGEGCQLVLNDDYIRRAFNTSIYQCVGCAAICYFSEATLERGAAQIGVILRRLTDALRAKTEFLARCSHELRTPLNGIVGSVDVIVTSPLTTEQRQFLKIAKDCSLTLTDIINDILDFSKIDLNELTISNSSVDLRNFIMKAIAPFQLLTSNKGVKFIYDLPTDLPTLCWTDEFRLKQVLSNLLSNALKFTSSGEIFMSVELSENFLVFKVRDTGIGVPVHKQTVIFEPFKQADDSTTRKYGGTGLGLSICKSIVEKLGGSIGVQSDGVTGSLFYFSVPYKLPDLPDAQITKSSPSLSLESTFHGGPLKVLLTEDNLVNQRVMLRLLHKLGIKADLANNGREAVEKASQENYTMIFMDLEMPVMDGRTAAQLIRCISDYRNTPIIAFTAHVLSTTDRDTLMNHPTRFTDFLIKPVLGASLKELLQKYTAPSAVSRQ